MPMSSKPSLLVVDDEASIRTALCQWFSLHGFDVDLAEDGQVAVEKCRGREYDAVTMDLDMPNMGGLEAIRVIRTFRAATPIVVLTGCVREADGAFEYGATSILSKPVRLKELEREVQSLIA